MKQCPNCHAQLADNAAFCTGCGTRMAAAPGPNMAPNAYPGANNPADCTAEFDRNDVAASKPAAMLVYLAGWLGIIVAMLRKTESPYLQFHVNQALKLKVLSALSLMIAAPVYVLLDMLKYVVSFRFIYILPPIVVLAVVITKIVIRIIMFVQVSHGKAVESSLVKSMPFLK